MVRHGIGFSEIEEDGIMNIAIAALGLLTSILHKDQDTANDSLKMIQGSLHLHPDLMQKFEEVMDAQVAERTK